MGGGWAKQRVKEKGGMDVGKSNTNNPLDVGVLGSGEGGYKVNNRYG